MRAALHWLRLGAELSPARLPAAGVVVVGSVLVFAEPASTSRWVGYAHDTGMYLSVLSFAIAGSFFAVAGYHTALRGLVRAPELPRASRPGAQVVLLRATGDLLWLLTGLAIVQTSAYLRTAWQAGGLELHGWSLSALGLCSASLCYGMGLMLGLVGRHVIGLFIVAVLPYALTLVAGEVAFSPASRFQHLVGPFVDQSWGVTFLPNHGAVMLLAAYAGFAAATLIAAAARAVRTAVPAQRRLVAVPLTGALTTGAILAAFVPGTSFYHPRATPYVCDPTALVCVRDVLGGQQLSAWQDADATVREALGELAQPELRFTEVGVPVDGYVELDLPPGRVQGPQLAQLMLQEHVDRLVVACSDERQAIRVRVELLNLIAPVLGAPEPRPLEQDVRQVLDGC